MMYNTGKARQVLKDLLSCEWGSSLAGCPGVVLC
jgi:hypothetical protein